MAERVQREKKRPTARRDADSTQPQEPKAEAAASVKLAEKKKRLQDDIDRILDEIDRVLEHPDTAIYYVQLGGE